MTFLGFYHSTVSHGGGGTGEQGPPGEQGPVGPGVINWRGAWDDAASYELNDAVSFEGSSYITINPNTNSEPPSADWDIIALQGSQGIQGIQGEQGVPGDQGDQGIQGEQGVPGDQGEQGIQGVPGDEGPPGEQGDPGEPGPIGMNWLGPWDIGTAYLVNDGVSFDGSSYIAISNNTGSTPPSADWDLIAAKGDTGAQGEQGEQGEDGDQGDQGIQGEQGVPGEDGDDGAPGVRGPAGGAITINYIFDNTDHTDSDPTSGKFHLNHGVASAATFVYISKEDANGADWSTVLTHLDDSTSTNLGYIRLSDTADESQYVVYSLQSTEDASTYYKLAVSFQGDSGGLIDTNPSLFMFTPNGDKGDNGADGIDGTDGSDGADGPKGDKGDKGDDGDDGISFIWRDAYSGATAYVENDVISYNGSTYICIAASTGNLPTNGSFWSLVASKGDTGSAGSAGSPGSTGATGPQGLPGGAVTIPYTFDTTTTDSDPGNGLLRLSSATQNASTVIRADLLDNLGTTWTTVLDSLAGSTSTVKGQIRLVHATDATKWLEFSLSSTATPSGYRNFTVVNVSGSTSSPFSNADPILFTFSRTGDKGDTGAAGSTGSPGSTGSTGPQGLPGGAITIPYTFSTTTTDSDPGSGLLRLSNATQNASTVIRADLLDNLGTTWTTVLDSLAGSTSTVKGNIRLVHATDATKWLEFTLSSIATPSGYRNLTVANVSSSTSSPFANADPILFCFTRTGDKGDTGLTGSTGNNGADAKGKPGGRLTLVSGSPASNAQTTSSTLYYTPYFSGEISLYNGSSWTQYTFSEISLSLTGLTTTQCYDVFIYDVSGTLTLEAVAWASLTARSTALTTQDGILVKNGTLTKRYLGTFLCSATSTCADQADKRYVYNYYNKIIKTLVKAYTGSSWTLANSTGWRSANADANNKVELVAGVEDSMVLINTYMASTPGTNAQVGTASSIDSTTVTAGLYGIMAGSNLGTITGYLLNRPTIGYHFYGWLEKNFAVTGTAATMAVQNGVNGIAGTYEC